MNMKQHILAALQEMYVRWEELLGGLSEAQINTPLAPSDWVIKDEVAHLRAWQTRTIARVEAAAQNREPVYPPWPTHLDPNSEATIEPLNDWLYQQYRQMPWDQVHREWREGFQRLLALSAQLDEHDLLDSARYPWMHDYALALVLLSTYHHHLEHYEVLVDWLRGHDGGNRRL